MGKERRACKLELKLWIFLPKSEVFGKGWKLQKLCGNG